MNGWGFMADGQVRDGYATEAMAMDAYQAFNARLAFDRSVRSYDVDKRLHIAVANISKANICGYMGKEIPDADRLGLEPDKIYQLLRAPEELQKAVKSANNLQLLSEHTPVAADDHNPDLTVGSTGTDAVFNDPYLQNSLVVWSKDAILGIESGDQKELSSGYRYRADMTPGTFKGEPYDGVMRDIIFNHVALVKEGRAGADVVVGDSQFKQEINMKVLLSRKAAMAGGALTAYLMPRLAADSKINIVPVLKDVTSKNFDAKKPAIIEGITKLATPLLAKDAKLDHLPELLDHLGKQEVMEAEAKDEENSAIPVEGEDEESEEEKKAKEAEKAAADKKAADKKTARDAFLTGKGMSAEDIKQFDDANACDEWPDMTEKKDEKKEGEDAVTPAAMDAALTKQRTELREAAEAREFVSPWIGKVSLAMDSAEKIYKMALDQLKVDVKDVPASAGAYRAILKTQPKPGEKTVAIAQDGAITDTAGFSSRWGTNQRAVIG